MSEAAKEGVRVRILRSFKDSFIKCSSLTDRTSSSSRTSSLHSVFSPSGSRWSIFKVPSNCPRALPFHVSSRSCILSCCWRHCICFVLVDFSVTSNCSLDWATLSGTSVRNLAFISAAQTSHHSGLLGSCCQALSLPPVCLGLAHMRSFGCGNSRCGMEGDPLKSCRSSGNFSAARPAPHRLALAAQPSHCFVAVLPPLQKQRVGKVVFATFPHGSVGRHWFP